MKFTVSPQNEKMGKIGRRNNQWRKKSQYTEYENGKDRQKE